MSAWSREPALAGPLADPACAYLVLDAAVTRILHASAGAGALARAIADAEGNLRARPALAEQIRRVGDGGTPRLARLALDPRRIAPPTLCLIAGGLRVGEAPALLLVAAGPLPAFRPGARAVVAVAGEPSPAGGVTGSDAQLAVGDRILWGTDTGDRLTALSGAAGRPLAPVLIGRSWDALARDGHLAEADAFLAAVAERRTIRGSSATLRLEAGSPRLSLALSGAPLGREGGAFSGYGGFALIRAVSAEPPAARGDAPGAGTAPAAAGSGIEPARESEPAPDSGAVHPAEEAPLPALPDAGLAAWPPALPPEARSDFGAEPAGGLPVPVVPSQPPPVDGPAEAALSVTEHDAFREIARALGVRYAGDDEAGRSRDPVGAFRPGEGAVMAFPAIKEPEAPPALPDLDAGDLVDGLPVALLIHRGDAVLAANARLLDLVGYPDLAGLQAVGIARLFRGLAPDADPAGEPAPHGGTVLIETAGRAGRPVDLRKGRILWRGEPAGCLILQPAPEIDPAREAAAARVARTFSEAHAADARATLDAIEDGVVTLDAEGRVVAMNRAAAGLFACDPREVVGGRFESLFAAAEAAAARGALDGTGSDRAVTSAAGRPFALRVSGAGAARVAVLRPVPREGSAPTRPASEVDRTALLMRLDHEVRTPLNGILGFADLMLKEPFGPLDQRYRGYLRDIHASGHQVLGLVADLSHLATIEAGRLPLAVGPLPLNEIVSACVASLQPEAARRRIVLRTSFSPDLAVLEADEPSVRQAAHTVIADAIRFAGPGGQVIVSTMPAERGAVALKVRDTGPGMSPDEIAQALEPFRSAAVTGSPRGTGLRLLLAKALVEANHGHLRASGGKDEGTLIEILLPGRGSRPA